MPIDLDAYCRRIGYTGPLAPTRETLEALIAHHAAAIPFENIDVLTGRVPKLDAESLERKLVHAGRGGYCFEQNALFFAVLRQIGFEASRLEARVRAGLPAHIVPSRTHMAVRVAVDGVARHADVGFGGMAPTASLAIEAGTLQHDSLAGYRFLAVERDLLLQCETHEGWTDCYRVTASKPEPADFELANWWIATNPTAFLHQNLLLARSTPAGRLTLFNDKRSLRRGPSLPDESRTVEGRAELAAVLADDFGLALGAAEIDALAALLRDRRQAVE